MGRASRRKQERKKIASALDFISRCYELTGIKGVFLGLKNAPPLYLPPCSDVEEAMLEACDYVTTFVISTPLDQVSAAKQVRKSFEDGCIDLTVDIRGFSMTVNKQDQGMNQPLILFEKPIQEMTRQELKPYIFV